MLLCLIAQFLLASTNIHIHRITARYLGWGMMHLIIKILYYFVVLRVKTTLCDCLVFDWALAKLPTCLTKSLLGFFKVEISDRLGSMKRLGNVNFYLFNFTHTQLKMRWLHITLLCLNFLLIIKWALVDVSRLVCSLMCRFRSLL
jgi:hypothetical protein